MNHNNKRDQVEWRRNKVQELLAKGNSNHYEIASILQVSRPTISRDIEYLRSQARINIRRYIDETLPEEYEKCLTGLTAILREAWNTAQNSEDKREKIQALSLAKECYSMKLDLLTNATVVDDAIRFVHGSKEKLMSSKEENGKESKEDDHDREKLGQKQEEEDSEEITTTTTTNHVF
jgi:hypothetical protein